MIFGAPSQITGAADLGQTGVDEQSAVLLGHPGGQLAVLHSAVRVNTPQTACHLRHARAREPAFRLVEGFAR